MPRPAVEDWGEMKMESYTIKNKTNLNMARINGMLLILKIFFMVFIVNQYSELIKLVNILIKL